MQIDGGGSFDDIILVEERLLNGGCLVWIIVLVGCLCIQKKYQWILYYVLYNMFIILYYFILIIYEEDMDVRGIFVGQSNMKGRGEVVKCIINIY